MSIEKKETSIRIINFDNFNSRDTRDLYFNIGARNIYIGEETFLTVSLETAAKIGDEVECEFTRYEVIRIDEERPEQSKEGFPFQRLRQGFTFQKLIIQRIR